MNDKSTADAMTGVPERYVRAMFGEHALHVPAWLVVQDQGNGTVALVGASKMNAPHPLRYGSERTHQLIIGELVVRPHRVVASDALRGNGLAALVANPFPLNDGEVLVETSTT
jgi:hypothetical protein